MNLKAMVAVAAASTLSLPCLVNAADTGAYIGFGGGQSELNASAGDIGLTTGTFDNKDTTWKLYGGYQFNKNWAVEAAYHNFGDFNYSGTVGATALSGDLSATGVSLVAVGILPLSNQFSVFGKLGILAWDAEASANSSLLSASVTDSGSEFGGGVGAKFMFTNNLGVRAEWERFGDGSDALDTVTASLEYKF